MNYLTRQFLIALLLILFIDLLAIYFTTTSPSTMTQHLEAHLNHSVEVITQIHVEENEFILYHDSVTNQLDVVHYEPNKLLFWRYQLANLYSTPKNAIVNHCQTYQTPDFFLLWGKNEDLQAKTLEIKFNNETYIHDLSQSSYFIYVYPWKDQIPKTIYCSFYDEEGKNISLKFFESYIQ